MGFFARALKEKNPAKKLAYICPGRGTARQRWINIADEPLILSSGQQCRINAKKKQPP